MSNPGLTNLKAWWKMDEASGTRYDEVGNVTLSQAGGVGYATGRRALSINCADFVSANSEYLINGTSTLVQIGPYHVTFGFWVKPHNVAVDGDLFGKYGDLTSAQEYMIHLSSSKIKFAVRDTNNGFWEVYANTFGILSNNIWYFVCATFDPDDNTIGIAVNDVWDATTIGAYGIRQSSADFLIGYRDGSFGTHFDGNMDDAFFYQDREFTGAQRSWLYNWGFGRRYEDLAQVAPPTVNVVTERKIPEIYAYDNALDFLGLIDNYSSLNWAERYNSEGDFELELPLDYADSPLLEFGNFLYIPTSDKLMIVEERKPTRTPTDGKLLINGRSSETILRRRELTSLQTYIAAQAEYEMYARVYWSVVFGSGDPDRVISLFEDGSGDTWPPAMTTLGLVYEQYETENIYEVIEALSKIVDLGFKIIVTNIGGSSPKLYFHTYEGADRSASQSDNTVVTFSYAFENLMDSSFLTTEKDKINITYVKTDDSVYEAVFVWMGGSSENPGGTEPTGINRFEGRLDTSIERDSDGDDIDDLSDFEVLSIIEERGEVVIKENQSVVVFDGTVDARIQFVIGEDFFLGDIVQVNAHGRNDRARIIEVLKSYSVEGERIHIAFDFEV